MLAMIEAYWHVIPEKGREERRETDDLQKRFAYSEVK